jgi:hypothetical protein
LVNFLLDIFYYECCATCLLQQCDLILKFLQFYDNLCRIASWFWRSWCTVRLFLLATVYMPSMSKIHASTDHSLRIQVRIYALLTLELCCWGTIRPRESQAAMNCMLAILRRFMFRMTPNRSSRGGDTDTIQVWCRVVRVWHQTT